jgi:hypothetical protein
MERDIVICIPSWRPPPLLSLGSYGTFPFKVIIVADPKRYDEHWNFYHGIPNVSVVVGGVGNGPQCAACYRAAALAGFPLFFKMDDDLAPKTFVHKNGTYPSLPEVIGYAKECLETTHTTLAGFSNTSRRDWLGDGYSRTYGLIHGGGNLGISAADPSPYMDERLLRGEDVYRTCAHRRKDGAVGRVAFVGFNKAKSADTSPDSSSKTVSQEDFDLSRRIILDTFPTMVTCTGTRRIHAGQHEIANWRMKR